MGNVKFKETGGDVWSIANPELTAQIAGEFKAP